MLTQALAAHVERSDFDRLPPEVVTKAKACILDALGCGLAGSAHPAVLQLRRALSPPPVTKSDAGASVWGAGLRTSTPTAALLNGTMTHVVNADDAHKQSMGHPATVVVPAALAVAETVHASGAALIASVVAGYECLLRVGLGIGIASHRGRGWYSTSSLGPFGAAAAAARILGLRGADLVGAIGHGGAQASGLWAFSADGSLGSIVSAGRAAEAGVLGALLVKNGFPGPSQILEADDGGLLRAMSDQSAPELIVADHGGQFMIMDVSLKPYPTSRTTHAPTDACLAIRARLASQPGWLERVSRVIVRTYAVAKRQADIPAPTTAWMASLSIQYTAALALSEGSVRVEHFTPRYLQSPPLRAVMDKVVVVVDDALSRAFPEKWSCQVEIVGDGIHESAWVESARGDPRHPMSSDEVRDKFHALSAGLADQPTRERICAYVERLEREPDVAALASLLSDVGKATGRVSPGKASKRTGRADAGPGRAVDGTPR